MSNIIADVVAAQEWLEPLADGVQPLVQGALARAGVSVRNALHGTWLGHPLHSALTDVPIGAWSVALALDVADAAGAKEARPGADAAVAIGLAGATASAVAGLADWAHTSGEPRRTGIAHATVNIAATLLYATSLALRRGGARQAGRLTGLAGFAAVMAGGFLGGHLVFANQIGVDHLGAIEPGKPDRWTAVLPESDLKRSPKRVEAGGIGIVLVRSGGEIRALTETCPHLGGPLAKGDVKGGAIRCPWHGSRFDLQTGAVVEGPSAFSARCFETRVRAGQIEVHA